MLVSGEREVWRGGGGGGGVIRQDGEGKLRCAGDSGYPGYIIYLQT